MTVWAWVAILITSDLTNILWRIGLHREAPIWTLYVRILLLGAFWVVGTRLPELRSLRPYLLALVAALIGLLVKDVLYQTPTVTAWIKAAPWRNVVIWSSAVKLLPAAAMAVTVLDLSRRELFLIKGDLAAPGRVPFTNLTVPWTWLGPELILIFGVATAGIVLVQLHPALQSLRRLTVWLPLVLFFSAINAFGEEFVFRSVLLARLAPNVGSEQALWMTSVQFGLGHWSGNPSGPIGMIGSTLLGLMLGKSMLETRGFFWAWLVHFVLDVVIFSAIILSSMRD